MELPPKSVTDCAPGTAAGSTLGWYKYANYCIGLDNFGMSGKGGEVMEYFGFTVEKIMKNICKKMGWD